MSAPQLFIEARTAEQSEEAEVMHLCRQAETCRHLFPQHEMMVQAVPTRGTAIRTVPAFEGKINRVVGFGGTDHVQTTQLRQLEALYAPIGLCPEIHLSPFADPSTVQSLLSSGYVEKGVLSTYVCTREELPVDLQQQPLEADVIVAPAHASETKSFIQASVAGFEDEGRAPALLRILAEIATLRADTRLFVAKVNKEIAGTAALAVIDMPCGQVGYLYLDSTLPPHRGRGVQQALMRARLLEARKCGLTLAMTTTRLHTGSGRNAERAGFRLAYTTTIFMGAPQ